MKMSWVPLPWWASKSTMATRSPRSARAAAATATELNRQKPIDRAGSGVVTGRSDHAIGTVETGIGSETIDRGEHGPGGEQGRVETGVVHHGVGVEPSTPRRIDRPDVFDQLVGVHQAQIGIGGPAGSNELERVGDSGLSDTVEGGPEPVGAFGVRGTGRVVGTTLVCHHQEHAAERTTHRGCTPRLSWARPVGRILAIPMALQSLSVGGARFRAGSWRGRGDLAYLIPLSGAYTLDGDVLRKVRSRLRQDGFREVVTAAVAPPERDAFLRDAFTDHETLHLLRFDLRNMPSAPRRSDSPRLVRGRRRDRAAILELDTLAFDEFWQLDEAGLDDSMEATPSSRLRVVHGGGQGDRLLGGRASRLTGLPPAPGGRSAPRRIGDRNRTRLRCAALDATTKCRRRLGEHPGTQHTGSRSLSASRVPARSAQTHSPQTGPRMTRGHTLAGAVLLAGLGLTFPLTSAGADDGAHLDLETQTTFVGEAAITIELRVTGADPTDRIQIRIYEPLTTLDDVRATYDARPEGPASIGFFDAPLTEPLDTDEQIVIEVPEDEVGELLRRDQGVLPVVIDLLTVDDAVRDTLTTHFVVLDDIGTSVTVAFIADLTAPLGTQSDQSVVIDATGLVERAQALEDFQVPVTVDLRPESVQAVAGDDDDAFAALVAALEDRLLLRSPWVDLDEEGWRLAGEADRVTEQFALGVATIEEHLGTSPTSIVRLDPDGTPETLGLLRTAGAAGAIVEPDQLTATTRRNSRRQAGPGPRRQRPPYDDCRASTQNSTKHSAATIPSWPAGELWSNLRSPAPRVKSNSLSCCEPPRSTPRHSWCCSQGSTNSRFWRRSRLPVSSRSTPPAPASGGLFRGILNSEPAPDLSGRAGDLQLTLGMVEAYATMVAPADAPVSPLRTQLLAAAAADLDDDAAQAYTSAVFDAVLDGTSGLSVVPSERITLTDRQTDLPMTLRNAQPLPITVSLVLSAEKLRFPDGEQLTLVLDPGDNPRTIRVETLASGDARVTATLTSPDGRLELGSGNRRHPFDRDIRARSRHLDHRSPRVLGGWWARTILRVRRLRAAATVAPAPDSGSDQPQGNRDRPYRHRQCM